MADLHAELSTPEQEKLIKPLDALSLANSVTFDPWASRSAQPSPSPAAEEFTDSTTTGRIDESLLDEFDPLSAKEQKDAWAEEDSHPPPPPAKKDEPEEHALPSTPPPPEPLPKQSPQNATFSPLSSIRRTFARSQASTPEPPSHQSSDIPPTPPMAQSPTNSNSAANPPSSEPVFDFQRFLDQMKLKSAEPVSKYLRSFLSNFAKKPFAVNDQIRIIQDFLEFIAARMQECDPWRTCSEAEFEHACEAMEKLVMNRLYDFTFTPHVAKSSHPVTTDDLERDHGLTQRIKLFTWIEEKHLDVPQGQEGFINFASTELLKINHFKAPRDKLICVLNSCKVIFGLIRHAHMDEGADAFVPVLIYVVLKTNPQHLISNIEYINRFRNPAKLQSEAGYYLSSLMGAVSFIETMDFKSLSNITQKEFEEKVEEAVQNLQSSASSPTSSPGPSTPSRSNTPAPNSHSGEESAHPLALATPDFSTTRPFVPPSTPNFKLPQPAAIAEDTKRFFQKTGDTIQNLKPFEALGKLFGDDRFAEAGRTSGEEQNGEQRHGWISLPGPFAPLGLRGNADDGANNDVPQTPLPGSQQQDEAQRVGTYAPYRPRVRPPGSGSQTPTYEGTPTRQPPPNTNRPLALGPSQPLFPGSSSRQPTTPNTADMNSPSRTPTPQLDLQGISQSIASIDAATAQRTSASMETLMQIFPTADPEVVEMVLEASGGDVGVSLEKLLEITQGG